MIVFYVLVAILPMSQDDFWGQAIMGVSLFKYLGGVCVLLAIIDLVANRRFPRLVDSWARRWFLIYFSVQLASYLLEGSSLSLADTSMFSNQFSILMLLFVALALIDSMPRLHWVMLAGIGGIAYNSLHVIREWQLYHGIYAGYRTEGGMTGDSNMYALQAMLWLPLCFYLVTGRRPRWEKLFCLGCLVVTLAGIALSASRGGLLALAAACGFMVLRSSHRARSAVWIGVLAAPMLLVHPEAITRLVKPSFSDQESSASREDMWRLGMKMFAQHPLVGVGIGEYKSVIESWERTGAIKGHVSLNVNHNTYIDLLSQLGLAGFIPFMAMIFCAFRDLGRAAQQSRRIRSPLLFHMASGMQAALVGFCVAAFFLSAWWERTFWMLLFVTFAVVEIARRGALAARASALIEAEQ